MTSTIPFAPRIQTDPALHLRTATEPLEIGQLRAVLDHEHYLKAGRPAGHVLWQGIYQQDPDDGSDTLVAVLCWGGAAKHLKDRDTWIGWDAVTCANRLKLVVQLRRFVVPGQARRPNLASQCLGLALRQLPDAWQKKHGYRPLLAESFHDPAIHQSTLYKVTNWTPLGFTRGFQRHRADFYQDLQSPKQLWMNDSGGVWRSGTAFPSLAFWVCLCWPKTLGESAPSFPRFVSYKTRASAGLDINFSRKSAQQWMRCGRKTQINHSTAKSHYVRCEPFAVTGGFAAGRWREVVPLAGAGHCDQIACGFFVGWGDLRKGRAAT